MFKCVVCEKVYVHKCGLVRHAKSHDGTTYSCGVCFKVFTRQNNLNIHAQNYHSKYTQNIRFNTKLLNKLFFLKNSDS